MAKQIAQGGLRGLGQQVQPQPRRADVIGFFHHQLPSSIEARRRPGKREGHQQAKEPEDRGFDDAGGVFRAFGVLGKPAPAKPPVALDTEQHADKERGHHCGGGIGEDHFG